LVKNEKVSFVSLNS